MIGSGILAIPFTMDRMGYVLGIVIFLLAGMMVHFTCTLLLKAKNLAHHSNYSTIFYEIWQSKLAKGTGPLFIFLSTLGVCIYVFKKALLS